MAQEPRASPAKVAYHLKQLRKLFPRARDHQFLQMVWAIDALRSGRPEAAARLLTFPAHAADQSIGSRFAIHRWELETLLIQLLLSPKDDPHPGTRAFDCSKFDSVAELVNRLRKLENVESAVYLRRGDFNVFGEMHRVVQRQFHWQRGYFNLPQFYRYAFIYAQGKCGEYFETTYGLPITELNFAGFALFAHSMHTPWISRTFTLPEVELTADLVKRALPLLLITADRAREETMKNIDRINEQHGQPIPTAFLPSILRRYPLLSLNDEATDFIAPIPEVLLMRVTSGLYYDLIPGGQPLLNEANNRFEEYCASCVDKFMERFKAGRAYRYEPKKGAPVDTPDLLVKDRGKVILVAECKATKLTYLAQFAEDPFEAEKKQYLQIANGVFQLWRFFSHVRRDLLQEAVNADTSAMVLTLDSFLMMSRELKAKIIEEAITLADKEGDITAEDRRHILFCPIHGLEEILCRSTEDAFLATLKAAHEPRYAGWELREVHREQMAGKELIEPKQYPFELDALLPWWKRFDEFNEAKDIEASRV
ncbi:MAG: hypothetical protein ACLP0B_07640 [Steroidobacteraceae bacterium]|jgi:hypothetical protein